MNLLLPDAAPFLVDCLAVYVLASFLSFSLIQAFFQRGMAWVADRTISHGALSFVAAGALLVALLPGMLIHFVFSAAADPMEP